MSLCKIINVFQDVLTNSSSKKWFLSRGVPQDPDGFKTLYNFYELQDTAKVQKSLIFEAPNTFIHTYINTHIYINIYIYIYVYIYIDR